MSVWSVGHSRGRSGRDAAPSPVAHVTPGKPLGLGMLVTGSRKGGRAARARPQAVDASLSESGPADSIPRPPRRVAVGDVRPLTARLSGLRSTAITAPGAPGRFASRCRIAAGGRR
jgi:hypothetical protein